MMTSSTRESAKIYKFPRRGRFAAESNESDTAIDRAGQRIAKISFGSGWYHDEAIREAERARRT